MDTTRVLICRNVRQSSEFSRTQAHGPAFRREASLWQCVSCLAKGSPEKAERHAPALQRELYLGLARKRYAELRAWVGRHPQEAKKLAAPLIAEYEVRAKLREARKNEAVHPGA